MKAIIQIFTIFICVGLLQIKANETDTTEKSIMKNSYYPVSPSVFILLRKGTDLSQVGDWRKIVNAALPIHMQSDDLSKLDEWENVIIIDEGRFWAVSLHHEGNGMLSYKKSQAGLKDWEMSIEDGDGVIIYLEKASLMKVSGPDNGLEATPSPWNPKVIPERNE